jgi:uncharacterized small protein (DUF1192 family)
MPIANKRVADDRQSHERATLTVLADELEEIIGTLAARIERQEALIASTSPCRALEIEHQRRALVNMHEAMYRMRSLSDGMKARGGTGPLH